MEKKKTCTVCKVEKNIEFFNKNKSTKDGIHYVCKLCKKEKYTIERKDIISPYSGITKNPTLWVKNCPSCGDSQKFQNYNYFYTSNKNNDVCRKCFFNSITQEKIIKKCECCSNLFETSNWNSSQKYCSQKCNANQKTINTTQLNQCLYCQKNFTVYTSLIKYYKGVYNIGSYCSRKCLCKSNIEKNQINGSLNGTNTKPELKFKKILDDNKIFYIFQHVVKYEGGKTPYKVYDFYIPEKNILVEIDGIYWHGKNKKYKELNFTQQKNRINDRVKNKLSKSKGYKLFRIWEDEIEDFNINQLI